MCFTKEASQTIKQYFCLMPKSTPTASSQFQFIALVAALMSVAALAIDALLPALDVIGLAIGIEDSSNNRLLVIMIFLGLGIGPLIFGPLSDSLGRKPIVYMGFALFISASFICVYATSLEMMILGRILQGIGLAAPRTISIAIIRDMYSGDYMARIMSFVTVVFILIPVIAPLLGKYVLEYYNWQGIFYIQVLISIIVSFWFWRKQPETLAVKDRISPSFQIFKNGFKEVVKQKKTMGYTLITGFISGSFFVYLSSSQQIFENQYQLKDEFPFIFAGLAISIGTAIFLNGTLVLRYGTEKLVRYSLLGFFGISLLYSIFFFSGTNPPVAVIIVFFVLLFFMLGFLFGNLRALAMEPVGHIAGIAAAITGFISTTMAVPLSIYIGSFVTATALPLFVGFAICSFCSLLLLLFLKRIH